MGGGESGGEGVREVEVGGGERWGRNETVQCTLSPPTH